MKSQAVMRAALSGILLLATAISRGDEFLWAERAGDITSDQGRGIAVDASGNSLVTGVFTGKNANFGDTLLASSNLDDVFVAKHDPSGKVLWAKRAGGIGSDGGNGVAVDYEGNSYVTGFFSATASFGDVTLTGRGGSDIFVAKYDAGGELVWVQKAGGVANEQGRGIAVDHEGNCLVTGFFSGNCSFSGQELIGSGSAPEIFVAKYGPSGQVLWARKAGGSAVDQGHAIAVDHSGSSYVTGFVQGTANFGGLFLTGPIIGNDVFVAKYNNKGDVLWARRTTGGGTDQGLGIAVEPVTYSFDPRSGVPLFACYVTGFFQGNTLFGGVPLVASSGSPDIFVARYDGNGNVLWAKKAGGTASDMGLGIAIDPSPTMTNSPVPFSYASYVTGFCSGTAVFGGVPLAGSGSSPDIFVAKYDGAGNVLWVKRAGSASSDQGLGIAVEQSSSSLDPETGAPVFASLATGYFAGMTSFGEIPLTSSGLRYSDIFVTKLGLKNSPPLANAGLDFSADEASSVALDGSGSSDPDSDSLTYAWTQLPGGAAVALTGADTVTPSFTAPFVSAGGQDLTFRLTVDDGNGHTATDTVVVHVDNKNDPPVIDAAQPTVSVLWPPNKQMVAVGITGVRDPDNNATLIITGVTQDEPANGPGDGDTAVDSVIDGANVLLRAERSGKGDGRVYRVSFTASDFEGSASGVVLVTVPQSRKGLAIDSGGVFSTR